MIREGSPDLPGGAAELVSGTGVALHRMPQMPVLFERLSNALTTDMKALTSAPLRVVLSELETRDLRSAIDNADSALAALFKVADWESPLALVMDRALLAAIMDAVFGGDGTEPPPDLKADPSPLELAVAADVFDRTARALSAALAPFCTIEPQRVRITAERDEARLATKLAPHIAAQLTFEILAQRRTLTVYLPRSAMVPYRHQLQAEAAGEADDPRWSDDLKSQIAGTEVSVRAVACGPTLDLGDIAGLKPGQILPLEKLGVGAIQILSSELPLFTSTLGQAHGRLCVRIETAAEPDQGLAATVINEAMRNWSPNA